MEFSAAILLLFNRTRLTGLLIATVIYANIIIVDIEFEVLGAIVHSIVEFVIILILLAPYLKDLKRFFWEMGGHFTNQFKTRKIFINVILPVSFIIIASVLSIMMLRNALSSEGRIIGAYRISKIIIKGDTLKIGPGKFTKEPMLFFEFGNNFFLTLNDSTHDGNYTTNRDSLMIKLNHPFNRIKSIKGVLLNEKLIKGTADDGSEIDINIERAKTKKDS